MSVPKEDVVRQQPQTGSTNVLVEMQKGNILVFKFVDEASGRTIQQIPSQGILNLASEEPGAPASPSRKDSK